MASAQSLINRALKQIGALSAGETPTSEETDDALTAMNAMFGTWRNDRLMVYALADNSLTLVVGQSSYTIGIGGDLSITRPVAFDSAYTTESGTDTPVRLIDEAYYDAIPDKTVTSSLVQVAFYNPTMASSQGTLKVWPVPSVANTLHLVTWIELAPITSLSAAIVLPQGYEDAIASNLALRIAPEYPTAKVSPLLVKMANDSLNAIKRINKPMLHLTSPMAKDFHGHRSNILIDA